MKSCKSCKSLSESGEQAEVLCLFGVTVQGGGDREGLILDLQIISPQPQ